MFQDSMKILAENASSYTELSKVRALTEAEQTKITDEMIKRLYDNIGNKRYMDYGSIPDSKGEIRKYEGYSNMVDVLEALKALIPNNQRAAQEDIDVVLAAIDNIDKYHPRFMMGFKQKKDFVILQYNTLVMACVTATTLLSIMCVDYVRNPQGNYEVHAVVRKENAGLVSLNSLKKFNETCKSGEFSKAISFVLDNDKDAFVGTVAMSIMAIMGTVVLLTIISRELVYLYYSRRVKLADFLRQQATFLENNKLWVEANTRLSAERQQEVIMKQNETAQSLIALADKISVDNKVAERDAHSLIKNENKNLNLQELQTNRLFQLA